MTDVWHTVLIFINQTAEAAPWDILVAAGVVSAVVGFATKLLNRKFGEIKGRTKFMLLTVFSGIAAGLQVLIDRQVSGVAVASQVTAIGFTAQTLYTFWFRPMLAYVGSQWRSYLEKAIAINEELKSAAVPDTGLPSGTVEVMGTPTALAATVVENDFSH